MTTVATIGSEDFAHILAKTRDAAEMGRPGPLSTGEALIAALILDRPDWLRERSYTIAEALERVGPEWARLIPAAAKQIRQEIDLAVAQKIEAAQEARLAQFTEGQDAEDAPLEFTATFVTSGHAPGYRDVRLTLDLRPRGQRTKAPTRVSLNLSPEDGETVVREITDIHRFAWRNRAPIDVQPGEQRPQWLEGR